jgi:two-component system alkaline phosphatase synthesis response regulator PhoP
MNVKGKILIADDEPDIVEIIRYNLTKEGFEIVTANNGDDAIQKAKLSQPDLIILDIMMPRKNGVEVCEILRPQPAFKDTVIVFLTALSDESSHIKGLETGADDYISKPVSPKILTSRIHAIFRRINKEPEEKVIKIDNLEIDPVKFEAKVDSKAVVLAKKEFELLYLLASKPGRVFLRNEILNQISTARKCARSVKASTVLTSMGCRVVLAFRGLKRSLLALILTSPSFTINCAGG